MYYLGFIQIFIATVGKFLSYCIGTSPIESVNAAANLFLTLVSLCLSKYLSVSVSYSLMYYLGLIQILIATVGKFLSYCIGTSPIESVNAAANLFLTLVSLCLSKYLSVSVSHSLLCLIMIILCIIWDLSKFLSQRSARF